MHFKKQTALVAISGLLPVLFALVMPSIAHAQTTALSGNYNNNTTGHGYDGASTGTYEITPTATFNKNDFGLYFPVTNANVTVDAGAQFENNENIGAHYEGNSTEGVTFTDNGGTYTGNGDDGLFIEDSPSVSLTNTTLTGNDVYGLVAIQSNVVITGGEYSGNGIADIFSDGSDITIYGDFGSLNGTKIIDTSGNATGTFENGGGIQTFSYSLASGGSLQFIYAAPIVTATPEPSSMLALLLGGCGLAGLVLMRKRSAAF